MKLPNEISRIIEQQNKETIEENIQGLIELGNMRLALRDEPCHILAVLVTNSETKPKGNFVTICFPKDFKEKHQEMVRKILASFALTGGDPDKCAVCGADAK